VRLPTIPAMADILDDLGFRLDEVAPDRASHRFIR
jgi:hypothetical protein